MCSIHDLGVSREICCVDFKIFKIGCEVRKRDLQNRDLQKRDVQNISCSMELFIVPSLLLLWVNNTATTGSSSSRIQQ